MGDWVKSFNFSTSTVECREVKDIFPSTVHELTVLSFGGKVLRATDNHPFYVPAADLWVPARSLHVGDELQTMSGSTVRIDDIQVKRGSFRVYNFEVEGNNNYYSGNVLVHNCNGLRSLGQGFRAIDSAAKNVPARWGHWSDLKKVQVGNKEYAEVGNLLYKQHAIERMAPNGLIQQGNKIYSRGVPPMVVEHAVKNGRKSPGQYANTVEHVFENVTVITDGSHKIVHTVIRKGH